MIIDEKVIMNYPPPPYLSVANSNASTATPHSPLSDLNAAGKPSLPSLPSHILIQILYDLFPADSSLSPHPIPLSSSPYSVRSGSDPRIQNNNYQARIFEDTKAEKQRKVLFWLSTSLRFVSKHLYIACMHVLRSIYLSSYQSLIRPPYSSDPFPLGIPTSPSGGVNNPPAYGSNSLSPSSPLVLREAWTSASPIKSLQRETNVLDRYIALKVRQDVFADDTELHIEPEESFRDLFDVAQPRARLEDLTRIYGVREGVVTVPGMRNELGTGTGMNSKNSSLTNLQTSLPSVSPTISVPQPQPGQKPSRSSSRSLFSFMKKSSSSPALPQSLPVKPPIQPLPFSLITVSFSPRRVGLIYNRSRTITDVQRALSPTERRSETLEVLAKALVRGLREYLEDS